MSALIRLLEAVGQDGRDHDRALRRLYTDLIGEHTDFAHLNGRLLFTCQSISGFIAEDATADGEVEQSLNTVLSHLGKACGPRWTVLKRVLTPEHDLPWGRATAHCLGMDFAADVMVFVGERTIATSVATAPLEGETRHRIARMHDRLTELLLDGE